VRRLDRPLARVLLIVGIVAIAGLAVGLVLAFTGGGKAKPKLSHDAYMRIYSRAVPGRTKISLIDQLPKPPYQRYHDNFHDTCFQWLDKPVGLYNYCFRNGTLVIKDLE